MTARRRRGRWRPSLSAPAIARTATEPVAIAPMRSRAAGPAVIRVEKDGRVRDIAVEDIYAIRANAHYCYVHDGDHEYFCNLSISGLEAMLDPDRFFRVHRSYIIRLSRVTRVKRAGEAAVAELGEPVRCSIPIARAQYREIRERVGMLSTSASAAAREVRQSG